MFSNEVLHPPHTKLKYSKPSSNWENMKVMLAKPIFKKHFNMMLFFWTPLKFSSLSQQTLYMYSCRIIEGGSQTSKMPLLSLSLLRTVRETIKRVSLSHRSN